MYHRRRCGSRRPVAWLLRPWGQRRSSNPPPPQAPGPPMPHAPPRRWAPGAQTARFALVSCLVPGTWTNAKRIARPRGEIKRIGKGARPPGRRMVRPVGLGGPAVAARVRCARRLIGSAGLVYDSGGDAAPIFQEDAVVRWAARLTALALAVGRATILKPQAKTARPFSGLTCMCQQHTFVSALVCEAK